jgi:hypothetical protein
MQGDPRSWSKVWEALDPEIGKPGENRGQIVAHFEGGSELDLGDKFSVTASGYYILPWGPQQIFLRGTKSSSESTKGGVSLTRDDGINLGIDYNLTRSLDLSAGYSRSLYSVLNTFSFGIGVNVSSLLKKPAQE